MRVLIVDDEPIARQALRDELESIPAVQAVGEAEDGFSALPQLAAVQPDVLFLDLHMPVMNGLEFVRRMNGAVLPAVVMLTVFDQRAVDTFEAGSVDYLLKPVSHHRLVQSLERARRVFSNRAEAAQKLARLQQVSISRNEPRPAVRKIAAKLGEESFLLDPYEVFACQAEGNLTWIITEKQRFLATQNLRRIEDRLPDALFRRIHRNALVNVEQIRKMSSTTSQRWLMTLNNGQELVVSKRQARVIRDVLHW